MRNYLFLKYYIGFFSFFFQTLQPFDCHYDGFINICRGRICSNQSVKSLNVNSTNRSIHQFCSKVYQLLLASSYLNWFTLVCFNRKLSLLSEWSINVKINLINNPTKSWWTHSAIHGQTIGPIEKFISLKFLKFL